VVADIAKLSLGREEYYTRELATDHEQYLSGHGESPGRWYGEVVPLAVEVRRRSEAGSGGILLAGRDSRDGLVERDA
jgi:hypothetical protein